MGSKTTRPTNVVRFKKPDRKREFLGWTRIHLANKTHGSCWHCEEPISAGEEYKRQVYTFGRKMWVRKEHYPLNCHHPDDEDEYQKWEKIRREEEAASRAESRQSVAA